MSDDPIQPGYDAAGQGRRLRMWRPPRMGPNSVTVAGLDTIVSRARAAHRNDAWAGAANDRLVSNLVGTGVQAKARNGAPELRERIKEVWEGWQRHSDADGVLDFYGQQALGVREWDEAGEVFARLRRRRPEDGMRVPLQVQLIESEQCPATYYARAQRSGNPIKAGIEFDAIGRRVAYWMYRTHPGEPVMDVNGTELVRVPADEVIHLYEPLRAGQLRGIPRSAAVLPLLHNIGKFSDNVLERQAIANLFALFYTMPPTAPEDQSPLGETVTGSDTDEAPLSGLEPGTAQELPAGMDVKFSSPPGAGADFAPYLRTMLMAVAARHGVPYEILTGDLRDVSDRALRLILNEFRRIIEQRQWLYLIPQFCQRIREAFFDAAVLAGELVLPGYAERRDWYTSTLWVPHGWPYSHPVQDVDADSKAVRAGFASRDQIVLARGEDPEQVDAEQAISNARADGLGLRHDSDGRQAKGAGASNAAPPQGETNES